MIDQDITLADQIFTRMRREIVEGQIPPGSKMSEPELARRYGISRGPLREALRRLESSSLVVRRANVGARVIDLPAPNCWISITCARPWRVWRRDWRRSA